FLAILIIFNAITTTQIGILAGFGSFNVLAKINGLIGIITFLLSVLLTYYWYFEGALLALLIAQVVNCVLNFFAVRKNVPSNINHLKSDIKLRKDIIQFSTPIALREALYSTSTWVLSIMIVKFSDYGQLGMHTAAVQWNAIILFIPVVLISVILSHLSSELNDSTFFQKTLHQTVLINFISTLIPVIVVILLSDILEQFYGFTFLGLGDLISLAVIITIFSSTAGVYIQSFISLGKNWIMFFLSLLRDIGIVVFAFGFIKYEIFHSAKAIIVANIVMNILFFVIVFILFNHFKQKYLNEKTSLYN